MSKETVTEYLDDLDSCKEDLAQTLTNLGEVSRPTESMRSLIGKVSNIPKGESSYDYEFDGSTLVISPDLMIGKYLIKSSPEIFYLSSSEEEVSTGLKLQSGTVMIVGNYSESDTTEDPWKEVTLTLQNGYYRNTTGEFVQESDKRAAKLDVTSGEKYKITTFTRSSLISGVEFFDQNDSLVSTLLDGTGSDQVIEDYEFVVPEGITSMVVQTGNSTHALLLWKYDRTSAVKVVSAYQMFTEISTGQYKDGYISYSYLIGTTSTERTCEFIEVQNKFMTVHEGQGYAQYGNVDNGLYIVVSDSSSGDFRGSLSVGEFSTLSSTEDVKLVGHYSGTGSYGPTGPATGLAVQDGVVRLYKSTSDFIEETPVILRGVATPINDRDAANKAYVDTIQLQLNSKMDKFGTVTTSNTTKSLTLDDNLTTIITPQSLTLGTGTGILTLQSGGSSIEIMAGNGDITLGVGIGQKVYYNDDEIATLNDINNAIGDISSLMSNLASGN